VREVFNRFLICLDIDDAEIDAPLTDKILENPDSPQVQLILTLHSMEPPTYNDLNSACRTLDPTKLQTLGPFAMAIY